MNLVIFVVGTVLAILAARPLSPPLVRRAATAALLVLLVVAPVISGSTSILFDALTAMCVAYGWNIIGGFAGYASFGNVESTGKRLLLALDVSGSMGMGTVAGVPGLTPRVASAAMALITAATEQHHTFLGFAHELIPLAISPRQRTNRSGAISCSGKVMSRSCGMPPRSSTPMPSIWRSRSSRSRRPSPASARRAAK